MSQATQNMQVLRNHIWTVSVCETFDSGTTGSSVPAHFPLPGKKKKKKSAKHGIIEITVHLMLKTILFTVTLKHIHIALFVSLLSALYSC